MNIVSLILLAIGITVGVLFTNVKPNDKTAALKETKKENADILKDPFVETEKAETININDIIIL